MQEHHVGKIKGPQTKNQNKSNTSSCAALENLIKSKSTFKSVNFGIWIQNVHQYYLCRWLLRDVQHFQNPCVSFICMFGTLSSVAIVLSSAGFFPIWLSISALLSLTELRYPAEYACIFVFVFPETDRILLVFQACWSQGNLCKSRHIQLKQRSKIVTQIKIKHQFPHENFFRL